MTEFNPKEFRSFADLPEEKRGSFQELEGDGFVRKESEHNPEIARRMGSVEDQIINTLKHELEAGGVSKEEALLRYNEAGEKYDYKNQRLYGEVLKKYSDIEFLLSDKDYDEDTKQVFKKRYDPLGYSEKTQTTFIESVDSQDLEVISRLLTDRRFTKNGDLIKLLDSELSIETVFDYVKSKDFSVVALLIDKSKSKDFKIRAFREISEIINSLDSAAKKSEEYRFNSMQANLAKYLILSNDHVDFFNLVESGLIKTESADSFLHEIESDEVLYWLATKALNAKAVTRIFKFVADPEIFKKVVETQGVEFKNLEEQHKSNVIKIAEWYLSALNSEPQIFEADKLGDNNKFVIGITTNDESKYYISWSNTESHGYHKDIFESLQRKLRVSIGNDFRSGGYVQLGQKDGKTIAFFNSSSGDFGNYSHKVLERFREKLKEALGNSLGAEVEVVVEISR